MAFFYKNYSIFQFITTQIYILHERRSLIHVICYQSLITIFPSLILSSLFFTLWNNQNIPYPPTKSKIITFLYFYFSEAFLQLFSSSLFSTLPQNAAMMFLYTITLTMIILSQHHPHIALPTYYLFLMNKVMKKMGFIYIFYAINFWQFYFREKWKFNNAIKQIQ